jgi:6-pyruvoyltetrahydropterin/6-carboxytetrahydropterin synthase
MAHALWNYNGKCKNIHGHSYKLYVTIQGTPKQEKDHPQDGMIMDFGDLKELTKKHIVDVFDHALILNENIPNKDEFLEAHSFCDNVLFVPFQPTSENIIQHFANVFLSVLPPHVILQKLVLHETASSFVQWENIGQ